MAHFIRDIQFYGRLWLMPNKPEITTEIKPVKKTVNVRLDADVIEAPFRGFSILARAGLEPATSGL